MAHTFDEDKWEEFTKKVADVYSEHEDWDTIDEEISITIGGYVKKSYRVVDNNDYYIKYIFLLVDALLCSKGGYKCLNHNCIFRHIVMRKKTILIQGIG